MGTLRADFSGEVALVTGGARGIGAAIVRALAQAGARVHAFDLDPPTPELAPLARFHTVDVTDRASVERGVDAVTQESAHIDLLVNNAGVTHDAVLWKLDDDAWQRVLDVNLSGSFRVLRAVAPRMRARLRGRVVQISSINGLRGKFGQSNYSASKAGLIGLTRTAARELGAFGITVNAVAPGMIDTELTANLPPTVRDRALNESALGKLGTCEDVADAVLFLLSDRAAHISGQVVCVDGGQTA